MLKVFWEELINEKQKPWFKLSTLKSNDNHLSNLSQPKFKDRNDGNKCLSYPVLKFKERVECQIES